MAWRPLAAAGFAALLAATAVWTLVAALVQRELHDEVAAIHRQNENLALALEEQTVRTLEAVDSVLKVVQNEYRHHDGRVDLGDLVATAVIDPAIINTVFVADAAGRVLFTSRALPPGNVADRPYFAAHREQDDGSAILSPPTAGRLGGRPSLPLSRRLSSAGGRFAGVVVAGVNPDYFIRYYAKMDLGRDGMLQLVGLDGVIRARHTAAGNSSGQDMRASSLLKAQALAPTGSFLSVGRLDGVRRYMSYRTVREYNLVVAVARSADEALAPMRARHRNYRVAAAMATLLAVLLAAGYVVAARRRERARREKQRAEASIRATFEQTAVGIAHTDLEGRFLRANPKFCDMLARPESALVGQPFADFTHPEDRGISDAVRYAVTESGHAPPFEKRYLRADGSFFWASVAVALVRDPDGRPDYFVTIVQDISEQKRAQEKVQHQAHHDELTGLANRLLFQDRLQHGLESARRRKAALGLLFLDLDHFKQVNDTLGHAAGDELLREVARRLRACLRASDTPARVGGDEFAVVLSELAQPGDAAVVAEKILAVMRAPFPLDGAPYRLTVSIGFAAFPRDGADVESLLRAADAAMFDAKRGGRDMFRASVAA